MTDREALLRAVATNPDDDTPRLIYADCLQELSGDANAARARFIRSQIVAHREPRGSATAGESPEIDALVAQYGPAWLGELPPWVRLDRNPQTAVAKTFSRGFAEQVEVHLKDLPSGWQTVFDTHPIRTLRVRSGSTDELARFFATPALARLRALAFTTKEFGNTLIERMVASPHLKNLRELDVGQTQVSDRGLAVLAASKAFPVLGVLRVGGATTERGLVDLLVSTRLPELWEVDLRTWRWRTARRSAGASLQARFPSVRIRY